MSNKSTENYLDNLLDSMNKLQDTDTKMSEADQDEFLKKFEDELENETYDEYLSSFEKELDRENEQAKGQALNVQTPAPDDKDASLDDMLTEFDRRMKEQEASGDIQENKADDNLSDAVLNFTPADSKIEMMDANMPEMAEDSKQEEAPKSIITNEPQMVEEIGEPDLAGNASKDILDILDSDGLDNICDLLEGKTDETGNDIDDYASRQMKVHEKDDGEPDAQGGVKKSLLRKIISFFTKEPQSDDATDTHGMADGTETDAQMLSDENKQILEALDANGEPNEAQDKSKKGKKPKKEKKPKKPKKEKKPKAPKEKKERIGWEKGPKLPKGPVIVIWVFVMSIVVFVLICTFLLGNHSKVTDAQNTYNQAIADLGQNKADSIELYTKAYSRLSGLKLSGDDKKLYNKLSVLAAVSGKYDAYKNFSDSGYVTMAADSLVCAAGRCALNADNAKEYGCETQLEQLKNII
ncbi:hypothetical protein, partial [Agathobacter sp.]|uniref:hypothetical protein n=1 Tax=Agathobacter sp. TaxID=2021311 RepID=UPI003FD7A808